MREKKLSNVRSSGADEKVFLTPPRLMTLEDAIGCASILHTADLSRAMHPSLVVVQVVLLGVWEADGPEGRHWVGVAPPL